MIRDRSVKIAVCSVAFAVAMAGSVMAQSAPETSTTTYVGSRTTKERDARGNGIEIYDVAAAGAWNHRATVELVNPSFLIANRAGTVLFTVHGDREAVSSFRIDAGTGLLDQISTAGTGGENPVHLALTPDEKFLVVANHETGNVASLPVHEDGSLGELVGAIELPGELGRNRLEQTSAHPHMVLFDPEGQHIIVPAKGLDKIFVMTIDDQGALTIVSDVNTRVGAGPRHAAFGADGGTLYVVNEIDSTLTAYRYDDGKLKPFQLVTTLPDDFTSNSRAAAIAVSQGGGYLFATNRGHDSVVRFAIDPQTGRLTNPAWQSSGGVQPRFLTVHPDGKSVLVTNVKTDTVVSFAFSDQDGVLHEGRTVAETGSPVSILFGQTR